MSRRIKPRLQEFFNNKPLTPAERSFILGCINKQKLYPQLTNRQWEVVCEIAERYKDAKSE
jgi:hypothetical protein